MLVSDRLLDYTRKLWWEPSMKILRSAGKITEGNTRTSWITEWGRALRLQSSGLRYINNTDQGQCVLWNSRVGHNLLFCVCSFPLPTFLPHLLPLLFVFHYLYLVIFSEEMLHLISWNCIIGFAESQGHCEKCFNLYAFTACSAPTIPLIQTLHWYFKCWSQGNWPLPSRKRKKEKVTSNSILGTIQNSGS